MSALTAGIAYKLLGEHVSRYLKESEGKAVSWNKKHKAVFEEITAKMDKQNYALLSALHLLTADYRLWKIMDGIIQKYHPDWMACGDIPPNALPVGGQNRTPADRGEGTGRQENQGRHAAVRRAIRDLRRAGLVETEQRYRTKGGKSSLLFQLKDRRKGTSHGERVTAEKKNVDF